MAALCNRGALYFCPVVCSSSCSFFLSFFPRLMSAVADRMFTLPHISLWCGLSANLRRRSEMCWMRLAENTGRKISRKNRHLGTIAQLCRAISSQLRHVSTIGKKLLKQQYLLHMSHNMVNFGPLAAEIGSGVWSTPS